MLALFIVLFLTTLYVPFMGTITLFFLSLPFVVFTARNGLKSGVLLMVGALIMTLIFGSIFSIPITFMMGSTGVIMGYLYKINRSKIEILSISSIAFILNILILYVVVITVFGINVPEYFDQASEDSISITREMMESFGQTIETEKLEELKEALNLASLLLPTVIVLLGVILAFISQLIATPILKRIGFNIDKFPPLREVQVPKSLIWYYLISMILMLVPIDKDSFLYLAVINLFYIMQLLMIFQGLSFIFYYCYHKNLSRGIPITIAIVSFLLPFLMYIVRIIGIIDLGFNLRSKIEKKK